MIGPRTTISPVSPTAASRHADGLLLDTRERHHAHLGVGHGAADAAGLAHGVARVEAAQDRGLRLAEALLEHQAVSLEGADQIHGHRGAGAEDEAQRAQIEGRRARRLQRLAQRGELRRHRAEEA